MSSDFNNLTGEKLLRIEYIPIRAATRWDKNPKLHDLPGIIASIRRYGFRDAPIYDSTLSALVAGHGRAAAIESMLNSGEAPPDGVATDPDGVWYIPVQFGNDAPSVAVAEAFAIDHNNLTVSGSGLDPAALWDAAGYADVVRALADGCELPETVGADAAAVLLGLGSQGGADTEPQITQTEAEKYQEIWQVKLGDVWQLGRHKIACVDSLNKDEVQKITGGLTATFVWADPPYGISIVAANGYVGGGEAYDIPFGGVKKSTRQRIHVGGGQRQKDLTGHYPIENLGKAKGLGSVGGAKPFGKEKHVRGSDGASNVVAVGKYFPVEGDDTTETAERAIDLYLTDYHDACHIWWGGNYYTHVLPPSPGWIVWDKDNTGNFADCELAWTNQHRAARIFQHRWNGMLKASEQGQRRVHPTQKPIALAVECFREHGQPEDVIVDPFLGSGISVLAAEELNDGRQVIGFDCVAEYIAVTLQRYLDHTGQTPERLSP